MKKLFIATLVLSSSFNYAQSSVRDFCRKANREARLSVEALANDGYIERVRSDDQADRSRYHGCRHDIDWMKNTRDLLCSGNAIYRSQIDNLQIPESFYFVFDGAADFNPNLALSIDPNIANIDGSEPNDLGRGNFNSGAFWLAPIRTHHLSNNSLYHVQYHASSGFQRREGRRSAIACFRTIANYLDILKALGKGLTPKVAAFGFSNGGVDASKFQEEIADKTNYPADLVMTIDPIMKSLFYPFQSNRRYVGERDPKTKRFLNFYQTTDNGSLTLPVLGQITLTGKPIRNADTNFLIDKVISKLIFNEYIWTDFFADEGYIEKFEYLDSSTPWHVNLVMDIRLQDILKCEIENLNTSSSNPCLDAWTTSPEQYFSIPFY